jgi:transposase
MNNKRQLTKKQDPPRIYSENSKRLVVEAYERGFLNKDQLQRNYNILGNDTIARWLRKYGNFTYPKHLTTGCPMKDPDKQHIKELEEALRQSQLDVELIKVYHNSRV